MNSKDFKKVVDEQIDWCLKKLGQKAEEYSTEDDRLYNFKRAAEVLRKTPEEALWGMFLKHFVSLQDIVEDVAKGKLPTEKLLEEKIGDSINYLILLEAMIKERLQQERKKLEKIWKPEWIKKWFDSKPCKCKICGGEK